VKVKVIVIIFKIVKAWYSIPREVKNYE